MAPSAALAETHLTDTSGGVTTLVKTGSKIKGIADGTSTFSGSGLTINCNENYITGEVVKNENGEVRGTINGAGFDSNLTQSPTDCESTLGAGLITIPELVQNGGTKHWCLENNKGTDNFTIFGRNCGGEGNGSFTFILEVTNGPSCFYKREAAITGTFTTPVNHEASTLGVTGEPAFRREEPSSFLCPIEGKITKMAFNLYTDTDNSITSKERTEHWDDLASTADPVWLAS
jgi:hypothetical protein